MGTIPSRKSGEVVVGGSIHDTIEFTIKRGEPIFILRAQDSVAADTVRYWAGLARAAGAPEPKCADAEQIAADFEAWPNKKVPD